MVTPISKLELRKIEIPREPLIEYLEREMGRPFTHQHRHYLAGEPVHCGDMLQIYRDNVWVTGRYEWTGRLEDKPSLDLPNGAILLDESFLLRWPP